MRGLWKPQLGPVARRGAGAPAKSETIDGTSASDSLTGGDGDDLIRGMAGGDTLHGGGGHDFINGGYGNDALFGEDGVDALWGSWGDDTLLGGAGDDHLRPGGGDGVVDGGEGRDTLVLGRSPLDDVSGATVDLRRVGPQNTGQGLVSFSGVEDITGTALGDTLTGDAGANRISGGGTGPDILDGQGGDDTLDGGRDQDWLLGWEGDDLIRPQGGRNEVEAGDGDDWIWLDADSDTTVDGGAGTDLVSWRLQFLPEGLDIELSFAGDQAIRDGFVNLVGVEAVTASEDDDRIRGSGADNRLYGDAGDDRLGGGGGDDFVYGDAFIGLDGKLGHVAPFHIEGSADALAGGAGSDTLIGGAGGDRLTGGDGADVFRYRQPGDSVDKGDIDPDLITDLEAEDVIGLARIDADRTRFGNQAFVLVAEFSGNAGELRLVYDQRADVTRIAGDRNGDGKADFVILAAGEHTDFTNFAL